MKGDTCTFSHQTTTIHTTPKTNTPLTPSTENMVPISTTYATPFEDDSISVRLGGLSLEGGSRSVRYSEALQVPSAGATSHSTHHAVRSSSYSFQMSPQIGFSAAPPKRNELCIFAMTGKCRYGLLCRSIHGIQCPRCLKFCLHPDDLDQNEDHIQQCLENPLAASMETEDERKIECGICYEPVLSKPDPRFGLLNCDHAFCISCIRTWRSKYCMDSTNLRSCPLCRTITYFVVPSSVWVSDTAEKQSIIESYKKKLGAIPCKHYSHGVNTCPFGTSCFYSHANPDGTVDKPILRSVVGESERPTVYRETRLSDFIVYKQRQ